MKTIFFTFILALSLTFSQNCQHYQLLDGSEELYTFGMDSTFHWWAVTKPFSNKYRMYIDGYESDVYDSFTEPVFSPNSYNWGYFAEYNGRFNLIVNDSIIYVNAVEPGDLVFAGINDVFAYSYKDNSQEKIIFNGRTISTYNKSGRLFISPYGRKYAYQADRGSGKILNINGKETTLYDDIIPFGFWHDGRFMYAAKIGYGWEVFLNEESQTQTFDNIYEFKINRFGTNAAFIGVINNSGVRAVLISDEYYEPLIGRTYDGISGLVLHPEYPLLAYKAKYNTNYFIVFNNTEYTGKEEVGTPQFTHNGDELFFLGCNIDCSLNINGKNYPLKQNFNVNGKYAIKPDSKTFAYTSSTSLIIYDLLTDEYDISFMVDYISYPRYNRVHNLYEAIGTINNKLYLITCE